MKRSLQTIILCVAVTFLAGFISCHTDPDKTFGQMLQDLYKGTVQTISPEQLENWQQAGDNIILLDIRSPEEFKVSHLSNARFLDYSDHTTADLQKFPKHQKIVVYCSVGYRSERVGEKMQQLGYRNVYNLYGGIFNWVNSGRPVYLQGRPTTKIHGYAPGWGKWLQQGDIVYE